MHNYDFFISHASEDKDAVARPIAKKLSNQGFRVWFDEVELVIGDSLTKQINAGLSKSKFGIIVLSEAFLSKQWPQMELAGLIARMGRQEGRIILPIWHGVSVDQIVDQLPIVADLVAISTDSGIDNVTTKLVESISKKNNDNSFIEGTWYSKDDDHQLYIAGWSNPTVGVYQLGSSQPFGIYKGVILDKTFHYKWKWINGQAHGGGFLKYSKSNKISQLNGEWWYSNSPLSRISVNYNRESNDMPPWLTLNKFKALMFDKNSELNENNNLTDKKSNSQNLNSYNVPQLKSNGDFILLVHQILNKNEGPQDINLLSERLENLLELTGIRKDLSYEENINAINREPIIALRTAKIAMKLAQEISSTEPILERSLNILRRDILLGITGVNPSLNEENIERCLEDYRDLMYCLVGAISDVASTAAEKDKPEAMNNYRKICKIVFK